MRPAGRGPFESLYFTYPKFEARRVAELDGAVPRHPVVISGAGPIGMTAALTLAVMTRASHGAKGLRPRRHFAA